MYKTQILEQEDSDRKLEFLKVPKHIEMFECMGLILTL